MTLLSLTALFNEWVLIKSMRGDESLPAAHFIFLYMDCNSSLSIFELIR